MSDVDDNLEKEFEQAFSDESTQEEQHKPTPEETPEKTPEAPESPEDPKKAEEEAGAEGEEEASGDGADKSEEKDAEQGEAEPKTEQTGDEQKKPEAAPLTKDDIREVVTETRQAERASEVELKEATNDVIEHYYPDGLSDDIIDEATGKPLRSAQDVIDASGGELSTEQATQWLMNERAKHDKAVADIRADASRIAETTLKVRTDGETVLKRYAPLFERYPHLQKETWDDYFDLVEMTKDNKFVLKAPDMQKYYRKVLEPYRLAFEHETQQSATAETPDEKPAEPAKPTQADLS